MLVVYYILGDAADPKIDHANAVTSEDVVVPGNL